MNQPVAEHDMPPSPASEPEGSPSAETVQPPPASEANPIQETTSTEETSPPSRRKRRGWIARVGDHLSWTASQRRGLMLVLALVLGVLLFRAICDRAFVPDPQPPHGQKADELASRLDPNTASAEELTALPQLGEKRAKAIVEYREDHQKWHPNDLAFKEPLDLVGVKGIGASMVENLSPYLSFPPMPPKPPATRAATKQSRKMKSSAK